MPSKKILLTILVCASLLGFSLAYKNYQKSQNQVLQNVAYSPVPTIEEKDSDGDGLKDWEEIIYGTDPNKVDTNNNGIDDKKEVASKSETKESSLLPKLDITKDKNLTETDKLTRSIFYDYLTAKSNNQVTSAYIDDLSKRAASDIVSIRPPQIELYTKKDLKIISGNITNQTLIKYGNDFIAAEKVYRVDANELSFSGISDAEDPAFYNWAIKNTLYYDKASKAYLSIEVPPEFVDIHLSIVNSLKKESSDFKILSNLAKDPIPALSALKRIGDGYKTLNSALADGIKKLNDHGIIFSGELGVYIQKSK
jgi:hypothetical protein